MQLRNLRLLPVSNSKDSTIKDTAKFYNVSCRETDVPNRSCGLPRPSPPPQVGTVSIKKSGRERFQQATGLPAPEVNGKAFPIQLGFTKTNELFVGRLAMLGFAASLVGELLTGQGALAQFGYGEHGGRSGANVGLRQGAERCLTAVLGDACVDLWHYHPAGRTMEHAL